MTENHETTALTASETIRARLTLDVTYTLNGVAGDLMIQNLRKMCERAIGEGMLTGNTEAEVDEYSMDVEGVLQEPWERNEIQFPRLIAEINATQDSLDFKALADSMDLSVEEVQSLFDRADQEWESIKGNGTPAIADKTERPEQMKG